MTFTPKRRYVGLKKRSTPTETQLAYLRAIRAFTEETGLLPGHQDLIRRLSLSKQSTNAVSEALLRLERDGHITWPLVIQHTCPKSSYRMERRANSIRLTESGLAALGVKS